MQNSSPVADDGHHKLASQRLLVSRKNAGRALVVLASLGSLLVLLIQILYATGAITAGFSDWRPILYAYLLWATALGVGQVVVRGEPGLRALFLLPAVLFTVAVVIFPTLFGIYIAS
ncbi:MAG TPA: sugar ABC transporter permease, partial [Xanthobacteraceae bacterium]|nr:sugar ABC transporter permease [Xanthobacteraceae bacterium]